MRLKGCSLGLFIEHLARVHLTRLVKCKQQQNVLCLCKLDLLTEQLVDIQPATDAEVVSSAPTQTLCLHQTEL